MKKVFFLLAFVSLTSLSFASLNPVNAEDCGEVMLFDCDGEAGICVTFPSPSFSTAVGVNLVFQPFPFGTPITVLANCNAANITLPTGFYTVNVVNSTTTPVVVEYKWSFCFGAIEDAGLTGVGALSTLQVGFLNIP